MIIIFRRSSRRRITNGNIGAQKRLEHFRHAGSIAGDGSFGKLYAVCGKCSILTREPGRNAASESLADLFIGNSQKAVPAAEVLLDRQIAGKEKERPEVLRLAPPEIGVGQLFFDIELNAAAVEKRLHSAGILLREEPEKLIDRIVAARTDPIIVGLSRFDVAACERVLAEVQNVPGTIDFDRPELIAVVPLLDILAAAGKPVGIQELSYFRFRKADGSR